MKTDIFKRIPFTQSDKNLLNMVKSLTSIRELNLENTEYFMTRTNTRSITSVQDLPPGFLVTPPDQPLDPNTVLNIDSFIITTSADPHETMKYTATQDVVVQDNVVDGGFF